MTYDWYEIWVDESPTVPYLLFLISKPNGEEGIVVIDPKDDDKIVYKTASYESAKMWLLEDEYTQVEGRRAVSMIAPRRRVGRYDPARSGLSSR